jgi:hypothetical protein
MIDEEVLSDPRARVDVDRRQEPAGVIDDPRQEEQLGFEQPVREAMETQRPDTWISQDFPA